MTRIPVTMAAVAALLALSACNQPGFRPEDTDRNRNVGALTGGALGAAAGALVGGGKEAVVGAAIGAGLGAVIGHDLDKQAEELRQSMGGNGVTVENTGEELIVTMPQNILFDVDSSYITETARDDLASLASSLQSYPDTSAEVIGHTDNTGSASHNLDLSVRRAQSVSGVMMANGVTPSRLRVVGAGEDQPIASNLTDEGKAQNRRVEIVIRPNEATG